MLACRRQARSTPCQQQHCSRGARRLSSMIVSISSCYHMIYHFVLSYHLSFHVIISFIVSCYHIIYHSSYPIISLICVSHHILICVHQTGRVAILVLLHFLQGDFKNQPRLGLLLRHQHVALRHNLPGLANIHRPLSCLNVRLRDTNRTAYAQSLAT